MLLAYSGLYSVAKRDFSVFTAGSKDTQGLPLKDLPLQLKEEVKLGASL
jgi:hypothetical protein